MPGGTKNARASSGVITKHSCDADPARKKQARRGGQLSALRTGRLHADGRRLAAAPATLVVLLGVGPEHLIGELFLLLGHRAVQVLERYDQLLHVLRVLLGELFIGLHVLDGAHCFELLSAVQDGLIDIARVLAHDLGELTPLRLLGRCDAQLRVQLFDAILDPLLRSFTGYRVPRHR